MGGQGWRARAACARTSTEVFYPEGWRRDDVEVARDWCRRCPVRVDCLQEALSWPVSQDFGIWGATTEAERRGLRKVITVMRGESA